MKRGFAGTRVVSVIPGNGWRFVKTRGGEEYCVAELMFEGGKLIELACYCFDEVGTMYNLHLRPEEIEDMSEISHIVNERSGGVYMYVFN